uniref:Uncharacterized protein n=1 Tax=Arundo donax TaxID=35708 RepID=A0A0A9B183_ARUDO
MPWMGLGRGQRD